MKIELKNVKFMESMSEETNCFSADIFVNGKKVGYAKNTGQGGPTDYRHYLDEKNSNKEVLEKAEKYCQTLPPINYGSFTLDSNLENVIDNLFEDWLKEQEVKKMEKRFKTGIAVGVPGAASYSYYDFKRSLETFPKDKLQAYVFQIKAKLKKDEKILNTNLEKLGLQL